LVCFLFVGWGFGLEDLSRICRRYFPEILWGIITSFDCIERPHDPLRSYLGVTFSLDQE